jgi:hypothetical protein
MKWGKVGKYGESARGSGYIMAAVYLFLILSEVAKKVIRKKVYLRKNRVECF